MSGDHDAQPVRDDRGGLYFADCTCGWQGELTTLGQADSNAHTHVEAAR